MCGMDMQIRTVIHKTAYIKSGKKIQNMNILNSISIVLKELLDDYSTLTNY